jgi:hypothetical protein
MEKWDNGNFFEKSFQNTKIRKIISMLAPLEEQRVMKA